MPDPASADSAAPDPAGPRHAGSLIHLPLDAIDATALPRDRTGLDPEPLAELRRSICDSGLHMPVEVFALPGEPPRYGLIAGYRRLWVFRALDGEGRPGFGTIPAILRAGEGAVAALRAMVEENEIRAGLSPWERGRAVLAAVERGLFANIEAAVDTLHAAADANKRMRIRAVARLAAETDGLFSAPERLSQNQLLRLADAFRQGFGPPVVAALHAMRGRPQEVQWTAVLPYLDECAEETRHPPNPPHRPGRPRRLVSLRPGLAVRRERTPEGFVLRFAGPEATSALLDEVLDRIERFYAPDGEPAPPHG